jgi:4,4'-diaponeurosporenoate glycosyltransferase
VDFRLLVVIAGWSIGWWLLWRPARLIDDEAGDGARRDDAAPAPTVAVVVPARDEARRLRVLLASLAGQSRPPDHVVVVDDGSTDETAEVARAAGVTVIAAGDPPTGWTGKAWACRQGAVHATSEVVLFVDADVELGPDGLAEVLAALASRPGLVSVAPQHRVERVYEHLSAIFNVVAMMGTGAASPGRHGRSHGAFGPVLACRRADYDAVGGHAAVRHDVADDLALARRFERRGLDVWVFAGGSSVGYRMYPEGVAPLVEGWSKNLATGAGDVGVPRLVAVVGWITAMLLSVQGLVGLLLAPALGGSVAVAPVVVAYVLFTAQLWRMLRQLSTFGLATAAGYPLLSLFFVVVFVRSVWLTIVRRRVSWRGRTIALSSRRRVDVDAGEVEP